MSLLQQNNPLLQIFPNHGVTLVRGNGALVWDEKGKEYIDCTAGWGVANIGHSHPRLVEAITRQATNLITCPGIYGNPERTRLAQMLVDLTDKHLDRVFFVNSGTEAVEAGIKFATVATGRKRVVAIMRGFHGRSLGSLSVTHRKKYRKGFEHMLNPNVDFIPLNNIQKAREAINNDVAAVIIEPVQGEGGIHIADQEFMEEIRDLCDRTGSVLIFDEVQTGFGRTGRMFAYEHWGVVPDIMCLAKSLGGGFPIGAVMVSSSIGELPRGIHGTTFGGNPLAMAAGIETLSIISDEDLVRKASEKGKMLLRQLLNLKECCSNVRDVRGLGLMIAIEFKGRVQPYIEGLIEEGILVIPTGTNTIRLLPPLVISNEDLEIISDVISLVIEQMNT